MDLEFVVKIVVTVIIAGMGWFVVHWLSSSREEVSKKRDIVTGYLIDAFSEIEKVVEPHEISKDWFMSLASALHKIQLFGNENQIVLVHEIFDVMQDKNAVFPNDKLIELLNILRDELRKEVKLNPITSKVHLLKLGRKNT